MSYKYQKYQLHSKKTSIENKTVMVRLLKELL